MRALYSLELKIGRRWWFIEAHETLTLARSFRERFYTERTTRIRKWVRP